MATLYLYCGAPSSGKTTIAYQHESEHVILDSDQVRERLYGDATIQDNPARVFEHMFHETCECLARDINVAYVATNISSRRRINLLLSLKKKFPNLKCICRVINTPIEALYKRNAARERSVPDYVIARMLRNFEMPYENEGWAAIEIIDNYDYPSQWIDVRHENTKIVKEFGSQKNSHHQLSLYDHCITAEELASRDKRSLDIVNACFLHDFGKVYTQTYWEKDNYEEAHYPNHANLSAYLALNMGYNLHVAQLCGYHMLPYTDERAQTTWQARLGEELWKEIMRVHQYDESSH